MNIGKYEHTVQSIHLDGVNIDSCMKVKNIGFMFDQHMSLEHQIAATS